MVHHGGGGAGYGTEGEAERSDPWGLWSSGKAAWRRWSLAGPEWMGRVGDKENIAGGGQGFAKDAEMGKG